MTSYPTLLGLIAPVFAIIGAGCVARWRGWMRLETEESLLKLVVNLLFPCLVFHTVLGNRALLEPGNVFIPPFVGFATIALGFATGYYGGLLLGLRRGHGLRTFAFAVGIYNYGYIPIPLIERLFGPGTLGVLFVHNIGIELAIWSVGIVLVAGASWRDGWRRMINPPAVAIVLALALNKAGAAPWFPAPVMNAVAALGACAVPVGLLVIGGTLVDFMREPRALFDTRVIGASVLLRLGLLPLLFLVAARWMPVPVELKQVMVVQAAMPAGILPMVIARMYGGQPLTAAQVIIGTTVVGLLVIPWWLKLGMIWVGV
jgi:malate permease and related proteins